MLMMNQQFNLKMQLLVDQFCVSRERKMFHLARCPLCSKPCNKTCVDRFDVENEVLSAYFKLNEFVMTQL